MMALRWSFGKIVGFLSLPHFKLSTAKPLGCEIETVSDAIKPGLGTWDASKLQEFLSEEEVKAITMILHWLNIEIETQP